VKSICETPSLDFGALPLAQLISICYTPASLERRPADHYARAAVNEASLIAGHGIDGDVKASRGKRQINFLCAEVVKQLESQGFRTDSGALGEQLVIAGLPRESLAEGVRLRLGATAVIEITTPRTPCSRFAHIQGKTIEAAWGRLGYLARVVEGGAIVIGAPVEVLAGDCP